MIGYGKLAAIAGWLVYVAGQSPVFAAQGPSFDCARAASWSEKAVCNDAALSGLDREVASLYREAKSHVMPLAVDVLKDDQKDWLRRRERCKEREDPPGCLSNVYRKRLGELASWAGRPSSDEPAEQPRPLPEITGEVVWDGDAAGVHETCDYGDYPCVLELMRSTGASEQAMRFGERVQGWATDFQELGSVDVVDWVAAFAANIVQGQALVNGTPDFIPLDYYDLTESDRMRPDVRDELVRLGDASIFSSYFVRKEPLPNGSRYIVESDFSRCNACRNEVLARAEIAYDLDSADVFQASTLLGVHPGGAASVSAAPTPVESASGEPLEQQAHQTRIELADGTIVTGETTTPTLSFVSSLGTVELPFQEIRSYRDEAATLADGSVLKGRFSEGTVELDTSRGTLKVPAKEIVAISPATPGPAAVAGAAPAAGQGTLTGRVLDNFGKPVADATIRILGSSIETHTDGVGRYQLRYVPGQLAVQVESTGYDPIQFPLVLSAATEYPVEDKVLLRLPPGPGVFYWDADGWTALRECSLEIAEKIDPGNLWKGRQQKEIYSAAGTPSRISPNPNIVFLDHRVSARHELAIFRVDQQGTMVTDTQSSGFAGVLELADASPRKGTSRVSHSKHQLFPGRTFLSGDFGAGVYAITDLPATCFMFQIGNGGSETATGAHEVPAKSQTLRIDGKEVQFWHASSGDEAVYFRFDSKGYRNTYRLDCQARSFLWTENFRISTGEVTESSTGAEWRPLNPNSTIANTVFDKACP